MAGVGRPRKLPKSVNRWDFELPAKMRADLRELAGLSGKTTSGVIEMLCWKSLDSLEFPPLPPGIEIRIRQTQALAGDYYITPELAARLNELNRVGYSKRYLSIVLIYQGMELLGLKKAPAIAAPPVFIGKIPSVGKALSKAKKREQDRYGLVKLEGE
jgi:hypothetical protein